MLILATTLVSNVRGDTKVDDNIGMVGVALGVKSTDVEEANTTGKLSSQGFQLVSQRRKWKQVLGKLLKGEKEV